MAEQFKPWAFPPRAVHVALDLETASLDSNAAIVQLAAVAGSANATPNLEFNERVSLASNERAGRHVSKETLEWWNTQDSALRNTVFGGRSVLGEVLADFHDWAKEISEDDVSRIVLWGNGTEFDNVILQNAFECFASWPFHYRNAQHMRTLLTTVPVDVQERAHNQFMSAHPEHIKHDALHDARYQHHMIVKGLIYHGLY